MSVYIYILMTYLNGLKTDIFVLENCIFGVLLKANITILKLNSLAI